MGTVAAEPVAAARNVRRFMMGGEYTREFPRRTKS
jgi:hypothetical protein